MSIKLLNSIIETLILQSNIKKEDILKMTFKEFFEIIK
ncbi:hypothetical protein IX314_000221 [Fusobacterium sp. DD26]|nr:hypothetical protein [Fusobacterium sp. DD45]MBR8710253.1 hypothetical protein [Fusobacterium sp. DD28]MBR8750775.1 hypothetical protein [Fusobacterium sp. DD26]